MQTLRAYQSEALRASKERFDKGIRRQLIALPTGTGKTVIFANLPAHHGIRGRVLVLVHRKELAEQAFYKLRSWCPGVRIGIEMGEHSTSSLDRIVVASVQGLGRQGSGRISKFRPRDFGLIMCDEAHHSIASTYKNVFEYFGVLDRASEILLVGFTATPNRGDRRSLGGIFDEIVYSMPIREAVQQGWLVDIKGLRVRSKTNLDSVKLNPVSGDFLVSDLGRTVNTNIRNELVLKTWQQRAEGRQTIVFCVDIQHAKNMALTFMRAGITAKAIWGTDPERASKLEAHQNGRLKVLANCEVLTEGYDDWQVSCVVMARPTQSELLFVQMAGRGTRIPNGLPCNLVRAKELGYRIEKDDCLIVDVVDNTARHKLVTLPTLFGLPANTDLQGRSVVNADRKDHNLIPGRAMPSEEAARITLEIKDIDLLQLNKTGNLVSQSVLRWSNDGSQKEGKPRISETWLKQALVNWRMLRLHRHPTFFRRISPTYQLSVMLNHRGRWMLQCKGTPTLFPSRWFDTALEAIVAAQDLVGYRPASAKHDKRSGAAVLELLRTMGMNWRPGGAKSALSLLAERWSRLELEKQKQHRQQS